MTKERWQKFISLIGKESWQKEPRYEFVVIIVLVLLIPVILWFFWPQFHEKGMVTVAQVTGISIFAIFYLIAQLIERIVELVSGCGKVFVDPDEIEKKKLEIDLLRKESETKISDVKKREDFKTAIESKENMETRRKIRLWGFSSILGVVFSYFLFGLFDMVGIQILRFCDSLFSGIIIGDGTKPLHDLITYIEKRKK